MIDEKKTELFETMPIPRAVAKLAVPTVISSIVMVLYNLADTYFVGLLNQQVQTAAVTFAAPVLLAFNAVSNLFGSGCSSVMSRALGRRDYDAVTRTAAFGFYCALACALAISAATSLLQPGLLRLLAVDPDAIDATRAYLFWTVTCGAAPAICNVVLANMVRAEGSSLHASVGVMSGCLLNVVLDPIFILPWGLNMGAAGAGCATFLSNSVACAYYLVLLLVQRRRTYIRLAPRNFRPNREIVASVCAVGVPASIQNLLNVTGMTVLNHFTAAAGNAAVAAMGITHKLNLVPVYFTMGLGQGILPLIGYNYASGDRQRMRDCFTFTLRITVGFIVAAAAGYYLGARGLIGMFLKDTEVVDYGTRFLRGFCLGLPFLAVDFLAVGIFQAVGMGRECLLFAVMRKIILEIPALYLLNRLYPLYGLAYAQLCAETILAAIALLTLRKLMAEGRTP